MAVTSDRDRFGAVDWRGGTLAGLAGQGELVARRTDSTGQLMALPIDGIDGLAALLGALDEAPDL